MNTFENAVALDFDYNESTTLINALAYKLSQKMGKQVVSVRFTDLLEYDPTVEAPLAVPDLKPSLETMFIHLATRMQNALVQKYSDQYKDVKVEVILSRWRLEAGEPEPVEYIGLQVKIVADGETHAFYRVDFVTLNAAFYPVALERLIELRAKVTADEPLVLLDKKTIHELTAVDTIDDAVLDSVSIAALAVGWNDTESYGKTMILVG